HFGVLVQMDGSFENWLEGRGPRGCLLHMVDDATSTSWATFAEEETTWGVADTLRAWVEKYGVPRALYVDWKYVYHHEATAREKADFHSELSAGVDLNQVFCLEQERKVSNDWVLQYGIRWLQIDEHQKTPVSAGDQVVIRDHRDGALTLLFKAKVLKWHELPE